MVAIAEEAYFKLSNTSRQSFNGVLLYGSDDGQIASAQRRIISGFKSNEEPLYLTTQDVRSDPAALESAFLGMSLFGGRRLIVVEGIEENLLSHLSSVLNAQEVANFVVFVAGSLNKSSSLRGAFEASRLFHCMGFYEETDAEFTARAARSLQAAGLYTEEGVPEQLAELAGGERGVLEGEIEKLVLYLGGSGRVTLGDVTSLCGNASAFDPSVLLEAMLAGDLNDVEACLAAARESDETGQMLNALKWHLDRMQGVRLLYEQSSDWNQAMSRARPPVHFKVKARWQPLLARVTSQQFDQLQRRLQDAILQSRKHAALSDSLTERFVFAQTREMRMSQR
jgi:DNA polymerase III subunit delta